MYPIVCRCVIFFGLAAFSAGQFCAKRMVNGNWVTVGDCNKHDGDKASVLRKLESRVSAQQKQHTPSTPTASTIIPTHNAPITEHPSSTSPAQDTPPTSTVTSSTQKQHTSNTPTASTIIPTHNAPITEHSTSTSPAQVTPPASTVTPSISCINARFVFSKDNHLDYVKYNGSVPRLTSFTFCAWVEPYNKTVRVNGTLLGYCVQNVTWCNSIWIMLYPHKNTAAIWINGKMFTWSGIAPIISQSHICIMMSSFTKRLHYYVNGHEAATLVKGAGEIPGGGVLILGQDQDHFSNETSSWVPAQSAEGFYGIMEEPRLWDKALTPTEIQNLHRRGCSCVDDAVVTFTPSNSNVTGHVIANWDRICHVTGDVIDEKSGMPQ